MRATLLGLLTVLSLAVVVPQSARAQSCAAVYASAFDRIRSSTGRGSTQAGADQEVESLFGPRATKCEAGAYQHFLESFESFARDAIRAAQPQKVGKRVLPVAPGSENQLRLAIAAIKKTPLKIPANEVRVGLNAYRQVRSNLGAVVEDSGSTAAMNDLVMVMGQIRAPEASEDGPPDSTTTTTTTTITTTTPTSPGPTTTTTTGTDPKASNVTAIRVPTIPLPTWAIIKIYEARDAAGLKDSDTAKNKLQDVIIWIESVTQGK